MGTEDQPKTDSPSWAAFMTQNTDRPFSRALLDALDLTPRREGRTDAPTWADLAGALSAPGGLVGVREDARRDDGEARRRRV